MDIIYNDRSRKSVSQHCNFILSATNMQYEHAILHNSALRLTKLLTRVFHVADVIMTDFSRLKSVLPRQEIVTLVNELITVVAYILVCQAHSAQCRYTAVDGVQLNNLVNNRMPSSNSGACAT